MVHCLDTDHFDWLDFRMPDEEKLRLYETGVRGAANFLVKFDWEKYKELRSTMVAVKHKSDDMVANAAVQKLINEVKPDKQDAAIGDQDI